MKTIILNQRKERDELMSRPYLIRRSNQDTDLLLNSSLIKLITGPRRVGKSTQALLMLRDKNFAYLNFDNYVSIPSTPFFYIKKALADFVYQLKPLLITQRKSFCNCREATSRSPLRSDRLGGAVRFP